MILASMNPTTHAVIEYVLTEIKCYLWQLLSIDMGSKSRPSKLDHIVCRLHASFSPTD